MAKALRNLQIFRNASPIIGTVGYVKSEIEGQVSGGTIVVNDGEPISVRYKEGANGEVKGLYGVAYVDATLGTKILWGGSGDNVSIVTEPEVGQDDYITLTHTYDSAENEYTLTAEANVVNLDAAEVGTTGLADALDVKEHIKYYDVTNGDNIVVISTADATDANGFTTTTFTVSISTENLPSAPEYTIGTTTTTNGYLKTYALFKDGDLVADSTIDIPKDFLVKSGSVIEVVEHDGHYYNIEDTGYTTPIDVSAAGTYIDFVINSKDNTATDEHIYVPVSSLVDMYTAGSGIAISTVNEISAKLSADDGNQISISLNDGGLFVPAGDTIVGVESVDRTDTQTAGTYGVVNGHVVELTWDNGNWYYDDGGTPTLYTGETHQADGGHRYLVVITSGGHQYWVNNDSSADIHVSGFGIGTNQSDEDVLRITMNNNDTYEVLVSDIAPEIPGATVTWDTDNDELNIGTEGLLTQLALGTIEAYIDNFDCGTF